MNRLVCLLGRSGRWSFLALLLLACSLASGQPVLAQGEPVRIIFLHHSTGHNLIEQGGVREGLSALGYEFSDHGYNGDGLRLADGSYTGTNFAVPDDNTDPDGLAAIFAQPLHDPPDNTFSHLMQYDVIVFKSCFPTSHIADDNQLATYHAYYLSTRDRMDQYPNRVFIIVTQPPEVPANSDPAAAARARVFVNWLQSGEYLAGHSNVFVFDFFGQLAGDDNFLRREYRTGPYDAHPNEMANRTIGPQFVAFIDQAIQSYDTGAPRPPAAEPGPPAAAEAAEPPAPAAQVLSAGVVEDFETVGEWGASGDGGGSTVECGPDGGMAHGGAASLRIHYEIAPGGWGDCGTSFEAWADWSGGEGLSLWMAAGQPGQPVTLAVFSGSPNAPTPFEVNFETTPDSLAGWVNLQFAWADFARAPWASEGGLASLDPAQVVGYGFSFGADNGGLAGTLWVDDISLVAGGSQQPSADGGIAVPSDAAQPGAAPPPEEQRRLCPLALALSLGATFVMLAGHWRR